MSKYPSCQSLSSGLIKVASKFIHEYQQFREEAAKIFVAVIIPGKPDYEKSLIKLTEDAFRLQNKLLDAYSDITGEGKGKIGERHLFIPARNISGELLVERTFVVWPSAYDTVTVIIRKTDGKAGADITACAKHATGEHINEQHRSIEKGKESDGQSVRFVFNNMENNFLSIHLRQEGFITDKCHYNLTVLGEFDKLKMQDLAKKSGSMAARS